ncbi:MAG: ImmA/IrrE family metallo-endopeptidase [Bacteroides sp.]|nr:ImmA/IrrE family metallo-endopeptidase [Bacteroides sp.]
MEKSINGTFSQRLRQARKMRGMSLEALSNIMQPQVSRQAINKYEKGLMMPDSQVLLGLSMALEMQVDFFFRPYSIEVNKVEFRKKAKCSVRRTDSIRERATEELERYLEIEQLIANNVTFDIKRKKINSLEEARNFALEIRNQLQLGTDGISNVIEILEDHGVKVIEADEKDDFDGLCGYANETIPIIVVSKHFTAERKRFTALHELGHLVMVLPAKIEHNEAESLCNAFASELLLPFSVLLSKIGEKRHDISLKEVVDIQQQFGISVDAVMYVLKQRGVITENRYRYFNIKKNKNRTFKNDVQRSRIPQESSGRFSRMVYRALADELISISKAANLLNSSVGDVRKQLQLL